MMKIKHTRKEMQDDKRNNRKNSEVYRRSGVRSVSLVALS